ncbi:MAG TPA: CHAT domain-containing protein [Anaerolineales bacterium]|nr:CHAT domain-containing protein [Anaerolineales bacterium]
MSAPSLVDQVRTLSDVASLQQLLEANAAGLDEPVAEALKQQADRTLRSDIQQSLKTAELLLRIAELTGHPAFRPLGLLALANARSIGQGEYLEAVELFDRAAHMYREQGREVDQARAQIGKLWALACLGRYKEAEDAGLWAGEVLERHAAWDPLAVLTMNLAIVYGRAGDDLRSLETFDRADDLYRKLNRRGDPAWFHLQQNRAVALRNLGRFDLSIEASHVAWEGLKRLGQTVAAARALQNLSMTYFLLGRYNDALQGLDEVKTVFLADGRRRDAMLVELFVSDCLLQLRRFSDVLEKCRQVRGLFSEIGTRGVVGQAMLNEAVAYAELGRHAEALDSLREARQIFEAEGNQVRVASTDLEMAAVLLKQGRGAESLALARNCIEVYDAHELAVEAAQSALAAAWAGLALGRYEQARQWASAALEVGERQNVPALRYQAEHVLGALLAARGDSTQALARYDRAMEELECLRGRLMVEFRVGFAEDKEVIYQDAVALCLENGQNLRGLEYAERAKSRALLDLVAYRLDLGLKAREPSDQPLVEELTRLRAERDRLYRRWESDAESGQRGWTSFDGERTQAQQEVLGLEKTITELWHRLLIRNADYARQAALWTVRTEPVQAYLDDDTVLVEYFVAQGKLLAFVVGNDRIQARRLEADLTAVEHLLRLLWLNFGAVPGSSPEKVSNLSENANGLLRKLHDLVLSPLGDLLEPYRRLIFVPHGALHYLPFHALRDGDAYLLERFEVSYLPGASFLRYSQEADPRGTSRLAVGNSLGGRLPHAVHEASQVASLLGGEALLEEAATTAAVGRQLPGCQLIHLAAHGDFRPDNPLFSGIALADGWLTTLDVFSLSLSASLVTLSACQTGRHAPGGGDELLGLMRAFLGAGAASLVLSLWAVEDRSTARLMSTFYKALAEGWSKGQALRRAQLDLLGGGDQTRHPYYWAPFFLVGNTGKL